MIELSIVWIAIILLGVAIIRLNSCINERFHNYWAAYLAVEHTTHRLQSTNYGTYQTFLRHLRDEHGLDLENDMEAIKKYGRLGPGTVSDSPGGSCRVESDNP